MDKHFPIIEKLQMSQRMNELSKQQQQEPIHSYSNFNIKSIHMLDNLIKMKHQFQIPLRMNLDLEIERKPSYPSA